MVRLTAFAWCRVEAIQVENWSEMVLMLYLFTQYFFNFFYSRFSISFLPLRPPIHLLFLLVCRNRIRFDSICVSETRALLFLRISLNCSKCVCGMNVVDFCLPHRHFPHTIEYLAKFDTNMCHFALGRNEAEHKAETLWCCQWQVACNKWITIRQHSTERVKAHWSTKSVYPLLLPNRLKCRKKKIILGLRSTF